MAVTHSGKNPQCGGVLRKAFDSCLFLFIFNTTCVYQALAVADSEGTSEELLSPAAAPNILVSQTILYVNPHDDDDDASQRFDSSSLLKREGDPSCVKAYLLYIKGALYQKIEDKMSVFFQITARISFEYHSVTGDFKSKQVFGRFPRLCIGETTNVTKKGAL
jgi:hypothetical protein